MRRLATAGLLLAVLATAGYGDSHLVGTWNFESTNLFDVMAGGFEALLKDMGTPQEDIDEALAEFREEIEAEDEAMFDSGMTLRADNTYVDSDGDGEWTATDDKLILVLFYEGGGTIVFTYAISSDQLTLSTTWAEWAELLFEFELAEEEEDEEAELGLALLSLYIPADTPIEFVFNRDEGDTAVARRSWGAVKEVFLEDR